jgi:hypothetical protein
MLQKARERLTLFLIAVLPFHALLVTVGTKILVGPGHAPLLWLAVWKEVLLGVIFLLVFLEWAMRQWKTRNAGGNMFDVIDVLIVLLSILSFVVTWKTGVDLKTALFGFKYDLLPLIVLLIARRVPWSERFLRLLPHLFLAVGCIIATYGIITFFLPLRVFLWLGYSPVHSLYFADGPLAAYQQIGDTMLRRIQGSFSGPNQLGLWLLIPLFVAFTAFLKERRKMMLFLLVLLAAALLLSLSRSAIIGGFFAGLVALHRGLPAHARRQALLFVLGVSVLCAVMLIILFPRVFWRLGSSRGHLERPLAAIQQMLTHPWGEGLGMAGPAQIHLTDSCVHLRPQDDPSWARNIPRLCVFVGDTQVQPQDRICSCPFLPENWYLQIGIEAGVLGLILYLWLTGLFLMPLFRARYGHSPILLAFLGVMIAALFLHAWEDSAVAYSLWLLLGTHFSGRAVPSSS